TSKLFHKLWRNVYYTPRTLWLRSACLVLIAYRVHLRLDRNRQGSRHWRSPQHWAHSPERVCCVHHHVVWCSSRTPAILTNMFGIVRQFSENPKQRLRRSGRRILGVCSNEGGKVRRFRKNEKHRVPV